MRWKMVPAWPKSGLGRLLQVPSAERKFGFRERQMDGRIALPFPFLLLSPLSPSSSLNLISPLSPLSLSSRFSPVFNDPSSNSISSAGISNLYKNKLFQQSNHVFIYLFLGQLLAEMLTGDELDGRLFRLSHRFRRVRLKLRIGKAWGSFLNDTNIIIQLKNTSLLHSIISFKIEIKVKLPYPFPIFPGRRRTVDRLANLPSGLLSTIVHRL